MERNDSMLYFSSEKWNMESINTLLTQPEKKEHERICGKEEFFEHFKDIVLETEIFLSFFGWKIKILFKMC